MCWNGITKRLAGLAVLGMLVAVPAAAHERVGGWLAEAVSAWQRGDARQLQRTFENGRGMVQGELATGRWRLQLHLQPGVDADAFDDRLLQRLGGQVAVRGTDIVDVWLPLGQVVALVDRSPQIAFAQLPWRPNELVGPKYSEGAAFLRAGPQFACLAADGTGTVVSVLDSGFDGLQKSHDSGEVPNLIGPMLTGNGSHGTMCAEVVADMAPGAQIYPYAVATFGDLQYYGKQITLKGNPFGIQVVSHSVIWLGHSFGRHEGKLCELTDAVRDAGVAWVSASGNSGGGQFYKAIWSDTDKDGRHEFQPGEQKLEFAQNGGQIQMTMDWDDYADRKINLDLYLYRKEGNDWVFVDASKLVAGKYIAPLEQVVLQNPPAGIYGLEVRALTPVANGTQLRIVAMGSGSGPLSVWHKNGNVYDPASCDHVLTVGAIYAGQYDKGPLEGYSSYGPTPDKRIKPEVMAPTGVSTSFGAFFGTSAACPHTAGALATWISATGQPPLVAADNLRKAAIPMGQTLPDEAYGWGRIALPPVDLGYGCTITELPGAATCETACHTVGSRTCAAHCRFSACAPPPEKCNQKDDNCDGQVDEGLPTCVTPTIWDKDAKLPSDAPDAEPAAAPKDAATAAEAVADAKPAASAPPPAKDGGCQSGRRGSWLGLALAGLAIAGMRRRIQGTLLSDR